ncbi:coiled-coil domain-containing protein [Crateriforma conspicua]|uniref:Uncharacterized protein n=1 Tax=Crateriforma conspicua TaxID=2527996 RepID=A0A5C5Y1Z1_9PLAN|nr:hypothetical protein [Crateriforma conspicua]TWT69627.1 hypothetical protein Pan14r_19160 [Crateriforma conspicua]
MASIPTGSLDELSLHPTTYQAITSFARRRTWMLACRSLIAGMVAFLAASAAAACLDHFARPSDTVRWAVAMLVDAIAVVAAWRFGLRQMFDSSPQSLARRMQAGSSRLRDDLLSAVELADPQTTNGSARLQDSLQRRISQRLSTMPVKELLPMGLLGRPLAIGVTTAFLFAIASLIPDLQAMRRIIRVSVPGLAVQRASLTQIDIIEPSPPSRYVAAGNPVAVWVELSGRSADDATLQYRSIVDATTGGEADNAPSRFFWPWQSRHGRITSVTMSDRSSASTDNQAEPVIQKSDVQSDRRSANVPVGSNPVEYRIIAGDAVTLWHRLDPLPRPQPVDFQMLYRFPDYADLPDRTERSDTGDLEGLSGSSVQLTITFNQAVDDATLRFTGNRTLAMNQIDDDGFLYRVNVPLTVPGRYQVTATSRQSGVGNEFGPQYSVTPVSDRRPTVRFDGSVPDVQVAAFDEISVLAGRFDDDLPIADAFQEFRFNGGAWLRRDLFPPPDIAQRTLTTRSEWDLVQAAQQAGLGDNVRDGDTIDVKWVVVDRLGQRAETELIQILLSDAGMQANRNDDLNALSDIVVATISLLKDADPMAERWITWSEPWKDQRALSDPVAYQQFLQEYLSESQTLADDAAAVSQMLDDWMQTTDRVDQLVLAERVSRLIQQISDDLIHHPTAMSDAITQQGNQDVAPEIMDDEFLAVLRRWHQNQGKRVESTQAAIQSGSQLASLWLEQQLSIARLTDLTTLANSLDAIGAESDLSPTRWQRTLGITAARLDTMAAMWTSRAPWLSEKSAGWRNQWRQFCVQWQQRLRDGIDDEELLLVGPDLVDQLRQQIGQQIRSRTIDNRILSDLAKAESGLAARQDLTPTIQASADWQLSHHSTVPWNIPLGQNLNRSLEAAEQWHRRRQVFDTRWAADMNLASRAVHHVLIQASDGPDSPSPDSDISPAQALRQIADDVGLLQTRAMLVQDAGLLRQAAADEISGAPDPIRRITHPLTMRRYAYGVQAQARVLKRSPAVSESKENQAAIKSIDGTRYGDAFQSVSRPIDARLYRDDVLVSMAPQIAGLLQPLNSGLEQLEPDFAAARQRLARWVLPIDELADAARRQTEKAAALASQQDSPQAESTTVSESAGVTDAATEAAWQEAQRLTRETIEALIDAANQADILDRLQRDRARDMETAARLVQSSLEKASSEFESDNESFQAAAAELQRRLRQTSQLAQLHQQAVDAESAVASESELSQQLRNEGESLQNGQEIEQRFQQAEQLADVAKADPHELLRRLEQELKTNPDMRLSLVDIAVRAVEEAGQLMNASASSESALVQEIEKADPAFMEAKRRLATQIESLGDAAIDVAKANLESAIKAATMAKDAAAIRITREAAQRLQDRARSALSVSADASLAKLTDTADALANDLQKVNEQLQQAAVVAQVASRKDIHRNIDRRRRDQQRGLEIARTARDEMLRQSKERAKFWERQTREAGTRLQQIQRLGRQLDRKMDNASRNVASQIDMASLRQERQRNRDAESQIRLTLELAEQKQRQWNETQSAIGKQSPKPSDAVNPAASFTADLVLSSVDRLKQIAKDLNSFRPDALQDAKLWLSDETAQSTLQRRQQVATTVNESAERLLRAGRHRSRLDEEALAVKLSTAGQAARQTGHDVTPDRSSESEDDSNFGRRIVERLSNHATIIDQRSDEITDLLASMPVTPPRPPASTPEGIDRQAQGKKLAQTLDELDRALLGESTAAAPSSPTEDGTSSQADASSSQQSPADAPPSGEASTALETSPTLAEAIRRQQQRMARQRQDAADGQNARSGTNTGQSSSGSSSSENLNDAPPSDPQSGFADGRAVVGPSEVDGTDAARLGSRWGDLRSQESDEAAGPADASVPPQYRSDVEAYFRAVAAQATDSKSP